MKASALVTSLVSKYLESFDGLPNDALVDVKIVAGLYDSGVSTVWARAKRGDIPAPIKIGGSARWRVGELRASLRGA